MPNKSSRSKILFISRSKNPDLEHYFEIKRHIRANQSIVLTSDDPKGSFYWPKVARNSLKNLFSISSIKHVWRLCREISGERVGTVVFDTADPSNVLIGGCLKFHDVRQCFTFHDQIPHNGQLLVRAYNWLVRRFLADEVIIFSSPRLTYRGLVRELRLGASPAELHPVVIGRQSEPPFALFFGRIEDYKGFEFVEDIAHGLRYHGCGLVIAGKGDSPYLSKIATHSNVRIMNRFIPDDEAAELFNSARVSIMPYREATQSGVLLFAAAFGVPTVAFDVGAIQEYMTDSLGCCVPKGDVQQFSDRVADYANMSQNDWAAVQERCLRAYDADFSAKSFIRQYEDLVKNY